MIRMTSFIQKFVGIASLKRSPFLWKLEVGRRFYATERIISRKRFEPSFGSGSAEVKEEVVRRKVKTLNELKNEKLLQEKKVRKLNYIDKRMLVYLGKYKSMEDVPNELVYTTEQDKDKSISLVKHELLGKVFKYTYGFEYISTLLTAGIFTFVMYHYSQVTKEDKTEEKLAESDKEI